MLYLYYHSRKISVISELNIMYKVTGDHLSIIRQILGYKTQQDFAELCGVTRQTIVDWESRETLTPELIDRINKITSKNIYIIANMIDRVKDS